MTETNKNTCVVYKNDLKFNDFDITASEFESEGTRQMYQNYKSRPKIELRIKDSEIENYEYLDLSKLDLTDELLEKLFKLKKIIFILKQIKFLDLNNNNLTVFPDLSSYPNIKYLSISFNSIKGSVHNDIIEELSCEQNKIKSIRSKSLLKLSGSNNQIESIDTPKIQVLVVNSNNISYIPSYTDLEYIECIDNQLVSLDNLDSLEELYISGNQVINLDYLPKIKVLNCVNNPIDKIKFFPKLTILLCSTMKISSKYKISNISKVKKDYLIHF
jgi:hypothetical protein